MKSSLAKNFAIAFYRYRMWLEEQQVPSNDRKMYLRDTNHFLAYLTLSSTDFSDALSKPDTQLRALRAYKRFLRTSMNADPAIVEATLCSIKHFCDFNSLSQLASAPSSQHKASKLKSLPSLVKVRL